MMISRLYRYNDNVWMFVCDLKYTCVCVSSNLLLEFARICIVIYAPHSTYCIDSYVLASSFFGSLSRSFCRLCMQNMYAAYNTPMEMFSVALLFSVSFCLLVYLSVHTQDSTLCEMTLLSVLPFLITFLRSLSIYFRRPLSSAILSPVVDVRKSLDETH